MLIKKHGLSEQHIFFPTTRHLDDIYSPFQQRSFDILLGQIATDWERQD
jgi:hypothetical protein